MNRQKRIKKWGCALLGWLLSLMYHPAQAQYVLDVLGDGYLCRTFEMPDDYAGKVVCTLVKRSQSTDTRQAVLYIHGYNDYFFQNQLGDSVNRHGYNFYALDLRKYGRSIRPNQDPFSCKSLTEYFADIDTALATIRSEGNEKVILMAHSTGGLISSYYLNSRRGPLPVDGLILNSPFLDWNFGWLMEKVLLPVVSFIGGYFPELTVEGGGAFSQYAASLLKEYRGEWEYDTNWKMTYGHPKKAGWIRAIHEAQQTVQKGIHLDCPVLLLSSDKSSPETDKWNDAYMQSDIVLDVSDIQKYGKLLGDRVTRDTIPDGMHDLILSGRSRRDRVYRIIFDWLDENLPMK